MLGQADVDADPAGGRLPPARQAARGRDRDRPRADGHRDAAQEGRRRASSSSSSARACARCRWPTARPSPTWRPSTARPAASSPSTPRRCATCASRAAATSRSRWSRPTQGAGAVPDADVAKDATYTDTLELDLGTVEPSVAGPKRPQDRVALARRRSRSSSALPSLIKPPRRRTRPAGAGDLDAATAPTRRPAEARLGRHRGHHELHEHVEPVGDAGRGPAGEEGGRAGPDGEAVGEDVAGARLEGGDRVPARRRG